MIDQPYRQIRHRLQDQPDALGIGRGLHLFGPAAEGRTVA